MELVERYLHAVSNYLPKAQADDITAELKDSLLSKIEEQENRLGRTLTDDELGSLIKANGHPMLVASHYLPQQMLIGPSVYPYWWFSLRLMLMIVGAIYLLLTGIAALTGANPLQAILQGGFGFVGTAMTYAAVLTVVFALLERHQIRIGLFDKWQPEKLAPIKRSDRIARADSVFELIFGVVFISWWLGALQFPALIHHDGNPLPFQLSAVWQPYWWTILMLAVLDLGLAVVNLLKPYWQWDRLLLRLLINIVSLFVLYQLFQHDTLVTAVHTESLVGNAVNLPRYLNQAVHGVLGVIALISLIEIVQDLRRLLRSR